MNTQNTLPASLPAQHTPGPWAVAGLSIYADPEKRSFGGPVRQYIRPVASVEVVEGGDLPEYKVDHSGWNVRTPGDSEAEANARLIAAAPELLAALEEAEKVLFAYLVAYPAGGKLETASVQKRRDSVRAALARAKGGAA